MTPFSAGTGDTVSHWYHSGVWMVASTSRLTPFEMVALANLKDNQGTLLLFPYTFFLLIVGRIGPFTLRLVDFI